MNAFSQETNSVEKVKEKHYLRWHHLIDTERWIVSIIIPVYNVMPYLREALNSVIHQTYDNLEILLIDDGSSDGSGEICDEYAAIDKRITVVHQKNQGLSAARNIGLDNASGKLIAFFDPDDAYCLNAIENMAEAMYREEADLIVCKYVTVNTEQKLKPVGIERPFVLPGVYNCAEALRLVIDEKLNISVWNKLYRSSLWQNIRFPIDRVYEDWPVALPIFEKSRKICVLSDTMYMHRVHSTSISMTPSLKKLDDWMKNYTEFESFVIRNVPQIFTEAQLQKTKERNIFRMIEQYVKCKNMSELRQFRINILEETKGITIKEHRNWCAYQALRFCPNLLRLIYRMGMRYTI